MQKTKITDVLGYVVEITLKLTGYIILLMIGFSIALYAAGYVIEHYMIPNTQAQHTTLDSN